MKDKEHFTCISYDKVDFLISNSYIYSGLFIHSDNADTIMLDNESVPYIDINSYLETVFSCKSEKNAESAILVFNYKSKSSSCNKLAVCVKGRISNCVIQDNEFQSLPSSLKDRLFMCGIESVHFKISEHDEERVGIQYIISPEKFFNQYFLERSV